ncbi:MAG: radical SAM protein [Planctomycetes bacterium]|nr:radical SAM protein [Planctomycetota bacterium]
MHGSLVRIPDEISSSVEELLNNGPLSQKNLPGYAHDLASMLIEGGYLVDECLDELTVLKRRFNDTPTPRILSLTLVPSLNCNLRCTYCYQERDTRKMSERVCDEIVLEVERRLSTDGFEGLEVDWFGGEPLLALDIISTLSNRLIKLAEKHNVSYEAAMATNGTLLNDEAVRTLIQSRVTDVQITLDGPGSIHNLNRPFAGGRPSFGAVIDGIKLASEHFQVRLRINVNRDSVSEAFELLDVLEDYGFFKPGIRVIPYIAAIAPINSICGHTSTDALPPKDFFGHVLHFQREVLRRLPECRPEEILEYPKILNRACGAQTETSLCVHPSGRVYKCGLEVHDSTLGGDLIWNQYQKHANFRCWVEYDPFARSECINCLFLPLCMGGCPKFNFDEEYTFKGEACIYWYDYLKPVLLNIVEAHEERIVRPHK